MATKKFRLSGVATATLLCLAASGCQKQRRGRAARDRRAAGSADADDLVGAVGARGRPAGARRRVRPQGERHRQGPPDPWSSFRTRCSRSSVSRRLRSTSWSATANGWGAARPRGSTWTSPAGCRALRTSRPCTRSRSSTSPSTRPAAGVTTPRRPRPTRWAGPTARTRFDDPSEKAAFKKKYKRELGVPETWEDLKTVAEFFTRSDKKRYGNVLVTGRGYDDIVDGLRAGALRLRRRVGRSEDDEGPGRARFGRTRSRRSTSSRPCSSTRRRRQQARLRRGAGAVREQLVGDADELLRVLPRPRQEDGRQGRVLRDAEERLPPLRQPGRAGLLDLDEGAPAQQELAKKFIAWFLQERPSRNG